MKSIQIQLIETHNKKMELGLFRARRLESQKPGQTFIDQVNNSNVYWTTRH